VESVKICSNGSELRFLPKRQVTSIINNETGVRALTIAFQMIFLWNSTVAGQLTVSYREEILLQMRLAGLTAALTFQIFRFSLISTNRLLYRLEIHCQLVRTQLAASSVSVAIDWASAPILVKIFRALKCWSNSICSRTRSQISGELRFAGYFW
jgi:hypothetical protein